MTTDETDVDTTWSIKSQPGDGHNDQLRTHRHPNKPNGGWPHKNEVSIERDGYPVVVMESGVDETGAATYHEQREIIGPAKTWDEAKEQVAGRIADDEEISETGISGLQDGGYSEVDYYAVEVLRPDD